MHEASYPVVVPVCRPFPVTLHMTIARFREIFRAKYGEDFFIFFIEVAIVWGGLWGGLRRA